MVESEGSDPSKHQFDVLIRSRWPMAQTGFVWQEQEGLIQPPQTPGDSRVERFFRVNSDFIQGPQVQLADGYKANQTSASRFSGGIGGGAAVEFSDATSANLTALRVKDAREQTTIVSEISTGQIGNEIAGAKAPVSEAKKMVASARSKDSDTKELAADKAEEIDEASPSKNELGAGGVATLATRSRVSGMREAVDDKQSAPLPPLNAPSLPEGAAKTQGGDPLQKLNLGAAVVEPPAKPAASVKTKPQAERPMPAPTSAPLPVAEPAEPAAVAAASPPLPAPISTSSPLATPEAGKKSEKIAKFKADEMAVDKLLEDAPQAKQSLQELSKVEIITGSLLSSSDASDKPIESETLQRKLKSMAPKVLEERKNDAALELRTVVPENLSQEQQASLGRISVIPQQANSLMDLWKRNRSGTNGRVAPTGDFSLIVWYRPMHSPGTVFGAQLDEPKLHEMLTGLIHEKLPSDEEGICLTILNSSGKPVSLTKPNFTTDWQRPYVATEIGGILPKWEAVCYLLTPDALLLSARAAQWKLGLMVLAVLAAALVGAALLWMEARRRWLEARLKSDFVSQVSHELKTPLTSIRMFSDLLVTNAPASDPVKTQKYAEVISQEAGRLSRLINSVLDFSRLERGDLPMQCQAEKLNRIVQDVTDHYRPHLESLGFQLNIHLPKQEVAVDADADRISQVLLNLLCNAEKYSGDGREIDVTLETATDSLATLIVADRGPGVPAGTERRIFEKFYRAHDSLHSGIPGTGLGLALARQIARAHQGDLTYKRRPGGGSQFILTIPISESSVS